MTIFSQTTQIHYKHLDYWPAIAVMTTSQPRDFIPVDRTCNVTPPTMGSSDTSGLHRQSGPGILTPPTSPAEGRADSSPHQKRLSPPSISSKVVDRTSVDPIASFALPQGSLDTCLRCPFDVKVLSDPHGGNQVFGSGAWSTVYKAIQQPAPDSIALLTPPSSPVAHTTSLLAVKVPTRRDADAVLEQEGEILTFLTTVKDAKKYIVPFFGLIPRFSALVLEAIPLSLEDHIVSCSRQAKHSLTTRNMNNPVIGNHRTWLDLSHKIITALDWLHDEAGVVHGDIKPGNFLLRPVSTSTISTEFQFDPIFIDFSSGRLLNSDKVNLNSLSAVTREYTAPELLSSAVLRDPESTATSASDVFSAAVTLLVAATGDTKVYPGSVFQRQAMATQGWQVLQLVKSGDRGPRVPRHGIVERVLERAVLKAGMGRVNTKQWLAIVEEIMAGEPSKTT